MKLQKRSLLFEEIILKSWWTILFFLLCFFAYDRGVHYRNMEKDRLLKKLAYLQEEKKEAKAVQEHLLMQIESQNDSSWIEILLMKGLGLVPEGQQKVLFKTHAEK